MIAWTIPVAKTTTGYTVSTASGSASDSYSGVLPSTTTGIGSGFISESYTTSRYTSVNNGTTIYAFTSSQRSATQFPQNVGGFTDTSGETSSVIPAPTAFVQTSTTVALGFESFETLQYTEDGTAWTTSYDDEASSVFFLTTEATVFSTSASSVGQGQQSIQDITVLPQTQTVGEVATIIQGSNEILYVMNAEENWNGYTIASNKATSGTRFTILPSYLTEQSPVADGTINPTSTTSNELISNEITWSATTITQDTIIAPFANFVGSAIVQMPIATSVATVNKTTTSGSSASFTVFGANTLTYNVSNSQSTRVITTSAVTDWGASRTKAELRAGTLVYETTLFRPTSASRIITTLIAASASSSSSVNIQTVTDDAAGGTVGASESGITANFNFNVYGSPLITTAGAGQFERAKFITTGAQIGNQRGGWFTAEGNFALPVAHAGDGRRGVTIFPVELPFVTASSNSVTFTVSSDTTTTTTSALVGLEGESTTTQQNFNQSFVQEDFLRERIQGAASPLPSGMTVVDFCLSPGAFKNISNGQSTSLTGGMTSYAPGESAPLSCWQGVTAVGPPSLRLARNNVYWAVARNPNIPPPGAPLF